MKTKEVLCSVTYCMDRAQTVQSYDSQGLHAQMRGVWCMPLWLLSLVLTLGLVHGKCRDKDSLIWWICFLLFVILCMVCMQYESISRYAARKARLLQMKLLLDKTTFIYAQDYMGDVLDFFVTSHILYTYTYMSIHKA